MAAGEQIGRVVVDVVVSDADAKRVRTDLEKHFAKPFDIKLKPSITRKAIQDAITEKTKRNPPSALVDASFTLKQIKSALRDKVLDGNDSKLSAKVDASFTRKQIKSALKESAGTIDAQFDVRFNRRQIQQELAKKSAGLTIVSKVDVVGDGVTSGKDADAARARETRAQEKFNREMLRREILVHDELAKERQKFAFDIARIDEKKKANLSAIANKEALDQGRHARVLEKIEAEKQRKISEIVIAGHDRRLTASQKARIKEIKAEADYERAFAILAQKEENEANKRREKRQLEESLANDRIRRDRLQHDAKMIAQQKRFEQTSALIAQRAAARRAALADRPIRIGAGLDQFARSLNEFDKTVTRTLKTSLFAFSAWSVGVVAAVGAVSAASIVSFARVELAARRAGAVFASDEFKDNIEQGKKSVFDFGEFAVASSRNVIAASNAVAKTTLFNPAEAAEGAKALAQAGFDEANALKELATVARFAQNEELDLAQSTEFLTGGLFAAGLEMKELTSLSDKFTVAANATNASAAEIAQAFSNQAAGAFKQYGQSVDQAITVLGLFAKANLRGAEAGTQASILVREVSRSAFVKAPEAWKKYGIAVEDATGKARPITKVLIELNALLNKTRTEKGQSAYQKLRKELDLTERSMRGLTIISPQLTKFGQRGLDEFERSLQRAAGSTERQSKVITDSVSVQFQNMIENIVVAFQSVGDRAAPQLKGLFDRVDDVIGKARGSLASFGSSVGDALGGLDDFLASDAFFEGARVFSDAIGITLKGVRDTFREFGAAFNDGSEAKSSFVAFAETVRAFAQLSATVLPQAASIIGRIIKVLVDNADSFEFFAKAAIGVYALRKSWTLLFAPGFKVVEVITNQRKALTRLAAVETLGPVKNAMVTIATSMGLVSREARAATTAVYGLTTAQMTLAGFRLDAKSLSASTAATAGAAAVTPAAIPKFLRGAPAQGAIQGAKPLSIENQFASIARAEDFATGAAKPSFVDDIAKGAQTLGEGAKEASRFSRAISGVGKSFAKVAGPIGLVVAAIEFGVGAFKGFKKEIVGTGKEAKKFKRDFDEIRPAINFVGDVLKAVGEGLLNVLGLTGRLGEAFGSVVASGLRDAVGIAGDFARVFTADSWGERLKSLGDALANFLISPLKNAFALASDLIASSLEMVPALKPISKEIRRAADAARDFKVNMIEAEPREKAKKSIKGIADDARRMAGNMRDAAKQQHRLAVELVNTTFAGEFKRITDQADKGTAAQIRFYSKLADGSKQSRARLKLLGITQQEAEQNALDARLESIKNISDGARKNLKNTFDTLNKNGVITPKLNRTALLQVDAGIAALQQKKREIRALDLSKNQKQRLITQANAAIDALRSSVEKKPVIVTLRVGDASVRGYSSERAVMQAFLGTDDVPGTIRRALENPLLVKQLSDSQREILRAARARAEAQGLGGDRNAILQNIANQISQSRISKSDNRRVKREAFGLGKAVADGLTQGASTGIAAMSRVAIGTANSYQTTMIEKFQMKSPSKVMIRQGMWIVQGLALGMRLAEPVVSIAAFQTADRIMGQFALGIRVNTAKVVFAARDVISSAQRTLGITPGFFEAGVRVMNSFESGMRSRFGGKKFKEGTIAHYLHVTIPDLIRQYKGPVAYDATILVPAGEAIMGGLDRGLKSGFGGVLSFLKDVGPSMEEFVPDSLFADRTKKFMVDVAMGDAPDPYKYYADLIPQALAGWSGIVDPGLSFLHPTLSLADTEEMARKIASLYGLGVTSTYRSPAENAAVGGSPTSQHPLGQAADISGSNSNMNKAASDLYAKAASVFKQIIFNNRDYIGGFGVPDHMDHVHLGFKPGDEFDIFSGKKGGPNLSIPGVGDDIIAAISAASQRFGLEPALIAAVMRQESGFRRNVVSFDGGYGLMQLTSSGLVSAADAQGGRLDVNANTMVGSKYLSDLIKQLGSVRLGLSAYNSGPGGGEPYGLVDVPNYVNSVLRFYDEFKRMFGGFRERGGPVRSDRAYVVGERGPEMFLPKQNGTVVNARDTRRMMQRETVYHDNRTYNVRTAASDPQAILDYIEAHSRSRLGAVNLR